YFLCSLYSPVTSYIIAFSSFLMFSPSTVHDVNHIHLKENNNNINCLLSFDIKQSPFHIAFVIKWETYIEENSCYEILFRTEQAIACITKTWNDIASFIQFFI